jgi:hypothetical protein
MPSPASDQIPGQIPDQINAPTIRRLRHETRRARCASSATNG